MKTYVNNVFCLVPDKYARFCRWTICKIAQSWSTFIDYGYALSLSFFPITTFSMFLEFFRMARWLAMRPN